jgi:dynein heavy chain
LIAEANYGGRITDDRDRRLIKVYANEIFKESLTQTERWRPPQTDELSYQYPLDEQNTKHPDQASLYSPENFSDLIFSNMENIDQPIAFGQHVNAEITSQIMDSNDLLESILSL